jgi:hypothetical protein
MFDKLIQQVYKPEYLRLPTKEDVKALSKLHKAVHQFEGMFGSLDCMHTVWKNCPIGWQGSYTGKEKKPTIVLEAISDHHLWFWHAAYGYAGVLNDTTILSLSPFMSSLVDGSFQEIEKEAVPFLIGDEAFTKMYILVDGIYPQYTRFVHGIKEPTNKTQSKYTKWQEASRKDIERAFGVLQGKWQCIARPMHTMDLHLVSRRMSACLILHNMCVSDRVMEDVYARYDPSYSVYENESAIEYPNDMNEHQNGIANNDRATIGTANADVPTLDMLTRRERWVSLKNTEEFIRLHAAIQKQLMRRSKNTARNHNT